MKTDDSEAHKGSKSFRITADGSTGSPTSAMVYYDELTLDAGKIFTIAFWAKVDGNEAQSRPVRINVQSVNSGVILHLANVTLDSTDWKEYRTTFTISGDTQQQVWVGLAISETATNLWIDDFRLFEGMPYDEFIRGDVSRDGSISAYDAALTLQLAVGLPIAIDVSERAADVNNDGDIGSVDAVIILSMVVGLAAPATSPVVGNTGVVTIALGEAYGVAGEGVTVPLTVDRFDVVAGGDVYIAYDPRTLRVDGILFEPETLLASNYTEPGIIRISFANVERLKSETLAKIQLGILADGISTLNIRRADLYNPDAQPLVSGRIDRRIVSWAVPPEHSALLQNFPNPLNPDTWIPYQLREDNEVTLRIFDVKGNLVRELNLGLKNAGLYLSRDRAAHWDGRNDAGETVTSGVYFYSISAGDFSAVKKLTVLR